MAKTAREIADNLTNLGHYGITEHGCQVFKDRSAEAKESLTNMFNNHPNSNGNGQIVIDEVFERDMDNNAVNYTVRNFASNVNASKYMLKKKDDNGKTLEDHIMSATTLPNTLKVKDADKLKELNLVQFLDAFDSNGNTRKSIKDFNDLCMATECFEYHYSPRINETLINALSAYTPKILRFTPEMKTSKAFNKIWSHYGFSGKKEYEKEFAKYSDMISDSKRNLKVVISTDCVDFLRMSWGVNWTSCHTTDPNWRRGNLASRIGNTFHGMYMNGCISYALDNVSFIVKVVDANADATHPEDWDNIYRCVFQYKDGYLLQGRVYPQGKDGNTDLYKKIRNIVQREICKALGVDYIENGTTGDSWARVGSVYDATNRGKLSINSYGHHYHDYNNFSDCNLSKLKAVATENEVHFDIGHTSICLGCGREEGIDSIRMPNDRLTCYNCYR